MTDLRIGLVVEGPTDKAVFEELLSAYCLYAKVGLSLNFVDLQPSSDASSGGGWRMVYKWCLNNPPLARNSQYFGPGLFDENMNGLLCDVILVHLDADVCEAVVDKCNVRPVPDSSASPVDRGRFIHNAIMEWLWPEDEQPDDRHIPCPAVEMIETWLIASHTDDQGVESFKDVLRRLVEIDFRLKHLPIPPNANEIRKSYTNYKRVAKRSAERIDLILAACPHFQNLVSRLFSAPLLLSLTNR